MRAALVLIAVHGVLAFCASAEASDGAWAAHQLKSERQHTGRAQRWTSSGTRSLLAPVPAPVPSTAAEANPYDIELGPWGVVWSQEEIAAQRSAGAQLVSDLAVSLATNQTSFTISPGTYRLNDQITIEGTTNFTLEASGVELIVENMTLHFGLFHNENLALEGPVTLDADPVGFTQGTIVDTDNATYVSIRLMDDYEAPKAGKRVVFFDQYGAMQPLYQVSADTIEQSSDDPAVFQLFMPDFFWQTFSNAREPAIAIGNHVSIESGELAGGINMGSNNGVQLTDIVVHSASLVFGLGERGLVDILRLRGVRRPATNRLSAGGFLAVSLRGGSLHMRDSELSYNFDDLTDVQSGLAYAFEQVSPTELYIGFPDYASVGTTLQFYNLETLAPEGEAEVASVQPVTDDAIIADFEDGLTELGLLNWNITPEFVTLAQPVNLTSRYSLVDDAELCKEFRLSFQVFLQRHATSIVFENCFMHDSLASGINAKGADLIIIRNNVVSRAGYRGASVGFDPYWWEGGVPSNILIEGNMIDTTPFTVLDASPAISTYVDTSAALLRTASSAVVHNVTVQNNIITNPRVAGIGLTFAASSLISNNTIVNPVAGIAQQGLEAGQPYANAAAIFLDTIAGDTLIVNNTIKMVDDSLVPEALRLSSSTDTASLTICGNSETTTTRRTRVLPDEAWTSVDYSNPAVAYSPSLFTTSSYSALGNRINTTFDFTTASSAGARATLRFTGTRAQWRGCVGPAYGIAAVSVDGGAARFVDTSLTGLPATIAADETVGFCGKMLFDTGTLRRGTHFLSVAVVGRPGAASSDASKAVAIESFAYLRGMSTCKSTAVPPAGFVTASAPNLPLLAEPPSIQRVFPPARTLPFPAAAPVPGSSPRQGPIGAPLTPVLEVTG